MSLGDIQAFIQYSRQFTMPITQIAGQMNLLQSGLASAERVFELLAADEEAPDAGAGPPCCRRRPRASSITCRSGTRPTSRSSRTSASRSEPGETVAIVGPTGAGKTTIVNLLMRFYEIDSGRICLDGVDTAALPRERLRSMFGMVLQDTWLFAGTIRDNIAYGKEGADQRR